MYTHLRRWTRFAAVIVAAGVFLAGAVAPANSYKRTDSNKKWTTGKSSDRWKAFTKYRSPRVTVSYGCSREIRDLTIHQVRWKILPDKKIGSEKVDCRSYTDAVRVKKPKKIDERKKHYYKIVLFPPCEGYRCIWRTWTTFTATVRW